MTCLTQSALENWLYEQELRQAAAVVVVSHGTPQIQELNTINYELKLKTWSKMNIGMR